MHRRALRSALLSSFLASAAAAQPGACCFPNGACSIIGQFPCTSHGGIYRGDGTACTDCGPTGACCLVDPGGQYCSITSQAYCAANAGAFRGEGSPCSFCGCYANCDSSTTPPILNVADFVCFQARLAGGDPWANCDGSTSPPILTVSDFVCFMERFAAGCP
jgi:hypothetical protein